MFQEIGAFDAKAKLSKLLRAVEHGQRYTITVRGKPIADLVPSEMAAHPHFDDAVAAMRAFKKVRGMTAQDVQDMVAEGRQ